MIVIDLQPQTSQPGSLRLILDRLLSAVDGRNNSLDTGYARQLF